MLVYDITNEKSFENIQNWIRNIDEVSLDVSIFLHADMRMRATRGTFSYIFSSSCAFSSSGVAGITCFLACALLLFSSRTTSAVSPLSSMVLVPLLPILSVHF